MSNNTEIDRDELVSWTRKIIESPFWIPDLETMVPYERIQDDHDGTKEGRMILQISTDGDVWFMTDKHHPSMRFRMPGIGGGMSPRVRNALMILAFAIKLDNQEIPQE